MPLNPNPSRRWRDRLFLLTLGGLSSAYVLLIVLLVLADCLFVSPSDFAKVFGKREILAAFWLTIQTCTLASIMALWVATPLAYLLARYSFRGKAWIDTIVDIPVVLPPLVVGISLLVLFHRPFPFSDWFGTSEGIVLEEWLRGRHGFPVTYHWPAVVLAQFAVATAFAVRTLRVTFEQIPSRYEDIARTFGCTRGRAFLEIALPQAWKGLMAAFTVAWARSLGEFGPILVFAGATRFRTEVLSTSVFLELSIGELEGAVAVSLLMVAIAVVSLVLVRWLGGERAA
ncbi:ABC transporter permease [Pirellulaceae bacterium SH467]